MKVAIVCDWLTGIGGAERVVLELHELYPDAPIYTSQYDPNKIDWFKDADVRTGWLQKLPPSLKKFLPVLRARYFSHLDLSEYDLVISSSGAEAKAVKSRPGANHVCYMHSPTHYYWSRYDDYMKHPGFGVLDPLARLGLKLLVSPMQRWDYKAAQRPDHIIANSNYTQQQIKKYYGRDAEVIHPPVDIDRFTQLSDKKAKPTQAAASASGTAGSASRQADAVRRFGFLAAGRQTPYKRIDLAVAACTNLGLPLTVIGDGPDHKKLVKLAGPTVSFMTGLSDKEVVKHFQSAEAFIFPGLDDFGIVAVEALAAGTPVIAYKAGGALDYVVPGKTGAFFAHQTIEVLAQALRRFKADEYDISAITKSAEKFSPKEFKNKISEHVRQVTEARL